jgi:hypothetical protein
MRRNFMRKIAFGLMLMLITLSISAINSNAGEYGFQFLQIPISPVASALAGMGIYASNYPGAFVLNPAANLMDENFNISVNHSVWLVDTNCSQIVYSKGNRNKHFGLSARVLDYGLIDTRDDTGAIIGNYHPLDANLMTNFAYRFLPSHMIGINIGLLYEKIETSSSYGINSDLGYVYLPPIANSTMFASLRNLGITSKMDNESIKLPLTYEFGLGYTLNSDVFVLSNQAAVNKAVDTDMQITLASEIALWNTLALRLGYKYNYSDENLTAGMGINWRDISINYGWNCFSDRLTDTHSFGVTYNF